MWRIFLLNTHTHKVAQRKIRRDRSESVWVQRAQREKTRIHSDTTVPLGLEHKVHTLEENVSQCVCTNEKTKRGRKMCVSATVCVCVCTPAGCTLITCITEAHTSPCNVPDYTIYPSIQSIHSFYMHRVRPSLHHQVSYHTLRRWREYGG